MNGAPIGEKVRRWKTSRGEANHSTFAETDGAAGKISHRCSETLEKLPHGAAGFPLNLGGYGELLLAVLQGKINTGPPSAP